MNFDQSERRKFSLRDCHGRFQERERIFAPNKRKQLYLLLPKAHQETGIMTAGASSKSGVFTIQLTCSTGLSLRADSSRTGAPSRSACKSNRPHDVNKQGSPRYIPVFSWFSLQETACTKYQFAITLYQKFQILIMAVLPFWQLPQYEGIPTLFLKYHFTFAVVYHP